MYNQKVMELQKANGISMFGACLPMIVTLVIFMVVFGAFSTYSQFANLSTYNDLVDNYNASVQEFVYSESNPTGFLIKGNDPATGEVAYLVDFDAYKKLVEVTAGFDEKNEAQKILEVRGFVRENARIAAADYYRSHRSNFLWVNNIWYPDSLLNKEIPNFTDFRNAVTRASGNVDASYEASYEEVTYYLRHEGYHVDKLEGERFNGYFILIVLAIGLMFLQQFISMRSQKDANELSTVDGSAAKTNKWMLIMMPVIYGVFSFFYSAAFSIYMITSTLFGLITTVIINKAMDVAFKKKIENGTFNTNGRNNRKRLK